MSVFWKWHVRFRLARALIHLGLVVWPPSASRNEVHALLSEWSAKVEATNAITRAQIAARAGRIHT